MLDSAKSTLIESRVEFVLAPELNQALRELEQAVEKFAASQSITGEIPSRLNLVLEELVTNSINYSLPDVEKPLLRLRLFSEPGNLVAQLEDNGAAFDPFHEAPKPDISKVLEERPIGGLGVYLVSKLTDHARYERDGDINRITLRMQSEK